MIKKLFLVVFAAFFSLAAYAINCTQYRATDGSGRLSDWHKTRASAANDLLAIMNDLPAAKKVCVVGGGASQGSSVIYQMVDPEWSAGGGTIVAKVNKLITSFDNTCNNQPSITAVYWQYSSRTGDYCEEECVAGPDGERTFFIGWNTAPGGDLDTQVPNSDPDNYRTYCDGSCVVTATDVVDCYTANGASENGYYKMRCEFSFSKTGATCSESTTPPSPDDDPPLPTGTPDPNPGGDDPTGNDDPTDCTADQIANGTCAGDGPDNDGDGDGDGPEKDPGACSAAQIANGTCPDSGDGSGGGTGGTTPTPDDPATCGGEGQPLCRVQVNESGTPDGSVQRDTMKDHGDKVTELAKDDGTFWTGVKTYLQKTANELAGWTWTFQLPTGCTPYNMGSAYDLTIDVCQFQGTIHDLMSFFWILATIYGLYRLFIWGID